MKLGLQGSGQLLGGVPDPGWYRAVAEMAESTGFDSLWAGDHVSFHNPILDVTVALAWFAAATEHVTLGAGVVLLPLRPPALVAREFASLDYVSGGRIVLGVGVGGEGGQDFAAVGIDPRERGARADEAMGALRALFSGPEAAFHGRFFDFEGITIQPAPVQPGGPPLWVGGRSDGARRRAARLGDGWMPIWISPERFVAGLADVRSRAESAGREPEAITGAVVCPARVGDDAGRLLATHLEQRYGMQVEPHLVDRYCISGSDEECGARIREYVAAGAEHLILNVGSAPGDEFLDQARRLHRAASQALQQVVANS